MEVADISDLDEDGAEEVVLLLMPHWQIAEGGGEKVLQRGAVGLLGLGAPDMQIPVLIRWDQEASAYRLQPLIAEKPTYLIVPFYGP